MKNLLLFTTFFLIGVGLISQDTDYRVNEFYEGYIIHKDGTRERGYIQYLKESDRYERVVFRKEHRGKRERFRPRDIAGYKVAGKVYHSVQYEDIPFRNTKFLILETEGCLNLYYYRKFIEGEWDSELILKNKDRAVTTHKFITGFANKMAEMVEDNEELAAKIRNRERGYTLFQLEAIIDEYNSSCNP